MIKRFHLVIMLFIWLVTMPIVGQSIESLENAKQAYEIRDFETAIQFFELTVSGGIHNGEIFYNLGNTHYQLGNLGKALLNYRRALQFLPRDLDLNIQIARTRALRTAPQIDTTQPIILMEQVTETALTIQELSIITLVIWLLFWILVTLYQLRASWRSTLQLFIGIVLLFVIGFGALLGSRLYIQQNMPPAIITVGSAPVYSGPSIAYFRQYDLFEASEIYITETQDDWSKFVTTNSRIGWIENDNFTYVSIQ